VSLSLAAAADSRIWTCADCFPGGGVSARVCPPLAQKKKLKSILIKLVSSAGTGFFYVMRKNPRRVPHKMMLRKHDPIVKRHVIFEEQKMKFSTSAAAAATVPAPFAQLPVRSFSATSGWMGTGMFRALVR
jgi:large subunit ribosomal protein L33